MHLVHVLSVLKSIFKSFRLANSFVTVHFFKIKEKELHLYN